MPFTLHDLTDLAGCRGVVALQEAVWGRDSEVVPASLLSVSIKRGGILIGASAEQRLVGFVWSLPAWRDGLRTHWSHMLGVLPEARGHGIAEQLKRAQRDRALAQDVDLIEWTFDPLQAPNAHLNMSRLGVTATTYMNDAYGGMTGPLHKGTPTDRLIAEWWIRRPHVERRLAPRATHGLVARSHELASAPFALSSTRVGEWDEPAAPRNDLDASRVLVSVPARFTEMQQVEGELALAWRLAARAALGGYLARGYQVVDFLFNREQANGVYLLSRSSQ